MKESISKLISDQQVFWQTGIILDEFLSQEENIYDELLRFVNDIK